jgi:hypothetical protein
VPEAARFPYQARMEDLRSADKDRQNAAFASLEEATQEPVDWAYEVWDDLLRILREGDNRQRAIGAQILCNLAKSDPKGRMVQDVEVLLGVTKDERFVTARHCLQSLWKVAVAGERQREAVVKGLVRRFQECRVEKNGTLIRYDILAVLRRVYDATSDPEVRSRAEALMDLEEDPKYRKKYATLWRV